MPDDRLNFSYHPDLQGATLLFGLSGWMDSGEVSTGTVEYLAEKMGARKLADFEPGDFYIYNFPGSMEISAVFRPFARIENGLVQALEEPTNTFYCSEKDNLILFQGKEPNLRWSEYADCILSVVADFNVSTLSFVGSVGSLIPHTREPRYMSTISHERLRPILDRNGLNPTNYMGPSSFQSYMAARSRRAGVDMISLVAQIPAYVQGRNVKSIESVVHKLSDILGFSADFSDLKILSAEFVRRLDQTVKERPELAEQIRRIEEAYDAEEGGSEPDDLQAWFEDQGIHFDQ